MPQEEPSAEASTATTCIGPGCTKPATPPSVYCGDSCVELHAREALKQLAHQGVTIQRSPSEFIRGSGGLPVVEKSSGKTLIGMSAPSERNLVPWLKAHPSYQVLVTTKKASVRSRGQPSHKAKAEGRREPESPSKLKMPSLMNPESVRANAKKALAQILMRRCSSEPLLPLPCTVLLFVLSLCACLLYHNLLSS